MNIEQSVTDDAIGLTELTLRSKAYWKYGEKQIEAWRNELTITPKYINNNKVYKLINNDVLIGFYAYNSENETNLKLNYLFVEPKFIGEGYGKVLMLDFLKRIGNSDFIRVVLDADPNVEGFYKYFGFRVIGKLKSSIKDRYLPIMVKNL